MGWLNHLENKKKSTTNLQDHEMNTPPTSARCRAIPSSSPPNCTKSPGKGVDASRSQERNKVSWRDEKIIEKSHWEVKGWFFATQLHYCVCIFIEVNIYIYTIYIYTIYIYIYTIYIYTIYIYVCVYTCICYIYVFAFAHIHIAFRCIWPCICMCFWKIILNNRRCLHHVGVSDLYQSPKMTNHPPKQHENLQLGGVEPSTRHLRWSANVDNKTWDWAGRGVTRWFPWKKRREKGWGAIHPTPKKK